MIAAQSKFLNPQHGANPRLDAAMILLDQIVQNISMSGASCCATPDFRRAVRALPDVTPRSHRA
ncbi:hypothetical protein [Paraburkholderia sp. BL17N1]|uniref:hypothetical protein n=1 Tax=Paraburkholderia sp. BL17N1 TaxID=1938798 RepID=UPI0032204BAF